MTALAAAEQHPHARAVLGAALAGGRPSHAYLLHGPAGSGKRAAAREFAAELLAAGASEPDAVRARVARGAHPDLTWVAPSGAHEMRVEDVAEPVIVAATRRPFEASRRVFVLEQADTLNDQAANRLLKTLEEPADYVHLVLVTDRLADVLPTIASRCQLVRFDPRPPAALAALLESRGVEPGAAAACARLGLADEGRALALALGEGPALRAEAERFARGALAGELGERPWLALLERARDAGASAAEEAQAGLAEVLETTAQRDRRRVETEHDERARRAKRRAESGALDSALELAGLWYRDVGVVLAGAPELALNADRAQELAADAVGGDPHALREAQALVDDTRARLRLNVTPELALEALAYRLSRALAG